MSFINHYLNFNNFCNCSLNNWLTPLQNFSFFNNYNSPLVFGMSRFIPYRTPQVPTFNYQIQSFNQTNNWISNASDNVWGRFEGFSSPPQFNSVSFNTTPSWSDYFSPVTDTFISSKATEAKTYEQKSRESTSKESSSNASLTDYNSSKGKKLAEIALKNSTGWSGYCAKFVKKAIKEADLGNYVSGHAYQMTDILKNNSNFKQISPDHIDVKDLPAGCILVFNRGEKGYSEQYGHVEITTNDGRGVSDGISKELKQPNAIFIPV